MKRTRQLALICPRVAQTELCLAENRVLQTPQKNERARTREPKANFQTQRSIDRGTDMEDKLNNGNLFGRRTFIKAGVALGLGALAAPAIVRAAGSSSGVLNFMGWSGVKIDPLFEGFTAETGIKINFIGQPDEDTMFAQCRLSLETGGIDCVEPSVARVPVWVSNGVVQPWDESKLALDRLENAFAANTQASIEGKRYFVPSTWGTEALTFSTSNVDTSYGVASLADIFDPKYEGMVTVRAHSALAALGRVMDLEEKLPHPFIDSYTDEQAMRANWDIILAEAISRKSNIVQFWNGETDAEAAFRTNGCALGLTWDTTGFKLKSEGLPFSFVAPKEGAFGWLQGYVLMKNAKNTEQAYAFANYVASAKGSAQNAAAFSSNPVGKGGIELMNPDVLAFYRAAYPEDALSKIWWWPAQPTWFVKLRSEYADKFQAA